MASPISSISIGAPVFQLISETSDELHYSSLNELIKIILSLAANDKIINQFYLDEAKQQLEVYAHLSKMMNVSEPKAIIHIRINPELKPFTTDQYLLASLMFLNVVDTEPTSVFHLTEDEINNLIQSHSV